MAQPFDSALSLKLIESAIREVYAPYLGDQMFRRSASETNRIFDPAGDAVVGDGKTFQAKTGSAFNARMTADALADFPTPTNFDIGRVKVRFNERDPSANDFVKLHGSARITDYDLLRVSSEGSALDIAENVVNDLTKDADFILGVHRHLPRSGRVAAVNGTRRNNDSHVFSSASTYTTGATSCRLQINNGSIAAFERGVVIDIFDTSGNSIFSGAIVTDRNTADNSIGLARATSTSTANFDGVLTTHEIFFSGMRNQNLYSIGAWLGRPATGDSFLGGVNRTTSANRWLVTSAFREGETARQISKYDLDGMGDAIGYNDDAERAYAIFGEPRLITALRQDIGEDAFTTLAATDNGMSERFANFGSRGLIWQHPSLGTVRLSGDPLVPPGTLRALVPGDWLALSYGETSYRFMPGNAGGMWSRLNSATPNNGGSMFYQCEMYRLACDFCKYPRRQSQILNVTAS